MNYLKSIFLSTIVTLTLAVKPTFASTSFYISTSLNTNLKTIDNPEQSFSSDLLFVGSLKLNDKTTIKLISTGNKEYEGERKLNFNDPSITISRLVGKYFDLISITGDLRGYLPITKNSREIDFLKYQAYLGFRFNFDLSKVNKNLSLSYNPYLNKYIHKYRTDLDGNSNRSVSITQRVTLSYKLLDKLSLTLDNIFSRSYTYANNQSDSFYFDQSITYSAFKNTSISIGHSNGGSTLALNGMDSNIKLFNQDNSTIYTSIGYSF